MEITSAEFIISNTDYRKCPDTNFPEYAFIGRSNVGKSSLINMLTGRKGLAMTSARPGKTMLINHFLVNKNWYLVDLPGYGYAKRDRKSQEQIKQIIESYILRREQMTCLFLLIDSRLEPQRIDLAFIEWLGENGVPFAIVFTKADKRTLTEIPLHSKKAKIYTKHPENSYRIDDNNGVKTLVITNPEKFWELTNFLVVQIN